MSYISFSHSGPGNIVGLRNPPEDISTGLGDFPTPPDPAGSYATAYRKFSIQGRILSRRHTIQAEATAKRSRTDSQTSKSRCAPPYRRTAIYSKNRDGHENRNRWYRNITFRDDRCLTVSELQKYDLTVHGIPFQS